MMGACLVIHPFSTNMSEGENIAKREEEKKKTSSNRGKRKRKWKTKEMKHK